MFDTTTYAKRQTIYALKVHSDRAKAKEKANIFFVVFRLLFDLFLLFFDFFRFFSHFHLVWMGL